MTHQKSVKLTLLVGLLAMALGGALLHAFIHPASVSRANYIPLLSAGLSLLAAVLFISRSTVAYGYVLNGMLAIFGIVIMAHYSVEKHGTPFALLSDYLLLLAKFAMGQALFELEVSGGDLRKARGGKWWRYPNTGWWLIHAVLIALVFQAGDKLLEKQPAVTPGGDQPAVAAPAEPNK